MVQVHAEKDDRQNVNSRDCRHAKGQHLVAVDVGRAVPGPRGEEGEHRQVIDDVHEDERPAPEHGARRVTGFHVLFHRVRNGPRSLARDGHLNRRDDMEDQRDQQHGTRDPEDLAGAFEKRGVGVQPLGPGEDLEVSQEVSDDEEEEDHAGDGHDHLLPDEAPTKASDASHSAAYRCRDAGGRVRGRKIMP
jgi:hypothetical protein